MTDRNVWVMKITPFLIRVVFFMLCHPYIPNHLYMFTVFPFACIYMYVHVDVCSCDWEDCVCIIAASFV